MANKPPKLTPTSQQFVHPEDGIGERIRERREELRLNYEELARMTARYDPPDYQKGLTPTMLARYEKGVNEKPVLPGARELRILCGALNVSADWLLLGDNANKQAAEITMTLVGLFRSVDAYNGLVGEGKRKAERESEHEQKLKETKKSAT